MNRALPSSTTILVYFLLLLFTFSSARIPFQIDTDIDHTNPNSFSLSENNNPSDPIEKLANSGPSTKDPAESSSNRLPLTVFSFDHRHPLTLSSRLGHRCHHYKPWKPRPRRRDSGNKDFGPVRHVARGWTRFGHVEPMISRRQRGMAMERSESLTRLHRRHRYEPEIKDAGLVKRIRKFLNQF